jgi:Tfp pilus assembly protein PilF
MSRRLVAALALLSFALPAIAQRRPPGASIPDLIDVRVRVVFTNDRTVPRMIRVQLLSGTGLYAGEAFTDDLGSVEFRVGPGNYRVRVTGNEIEETTTDVFTVYSRQGSHTETVTVERKPVEGGGATSTEGTISMVDLNVPRKAERELEKGARAMEKKAMEKAEEHFRKAIELHPGYATAHNYLGVVMMNTGRPGDGRAAFARAVELNDNYSAAHVNMAKVLFGEKNAKDAEPHLLKALKTDPLNAEILTLLSNAQLINGNFQDAVANARKVHSIPHEQFAIVHYVAARALEASQQRGEAVVEYTMYLKEAPQGPLADESRERIDAYKNGRN